MKQATPEAIKILASESKKIRIEDAEVITKLLDSWRTFESTELAFLIKQTEIFCKDKCVIITTINKPTETILKHIRNTEYDVIIVGDNKTPDDYKNLNCIYLDIPSKKKLFPELSDLLPYNHYCRNNLGYLYAIKKGYTII